jgi:hypothetical protein
MFPPAQTVIRTRDKILRIEGLNLTCRALPFMWASNSTELAAR